MARELHSVEILKEIAVSPDSRSLDSGEYQELTCLTSVNPATYCAVSLIQRFCL